jgi:pyruvate formate lyase activating enzyme
MEKGLVFKIERSSTVDGPGIRTVIFFKGCPLNCLWCQNPEGLRPVPEVMWDPKKCIRCGTCVKECPQKAVSLINGEVVTNKDLCKKCGTCEKVCPVKAREICGKYMDVEELLDKVTRDKIFYYHSGGGVTASGGEPTFQPYFLDKFFQRCQGAGIHTALDTCGFVETKTFTRILKYTNLVLYDLKILDPQKSVTYTGADIYLILNNLEVCDKMGLPIWIRVPIVPGYTDTTDNISKIIDITARLKNLQRIDILPYNSFGSQKYVMVGREYKLIDLKPPSLENMHMIKKLFNSRGLTNVFIG